MPTILRIGSYRFYFYSHEPNKDEASAKFWLKKISLAQNIGFAKKELNELHRLVEEHQNFFFG